MAAYCHRCQRSFRTWDALDRHTRHSRKHNECPECDFDGTSWDDLLGHCYEQGCRIVCEGCNDGQGSHWPVDRRAYDEHMITENVCDECDRHFDSPSNLYQHKLSHRELMYECLCCDRSFKTYGGMIIHLECGTCADTSETSLNELAAECHKWRHFIDEDYHEDMYQGLALAQYGTIYPYMCPTCDVGLRKLSSLFQHIESDSCGLCLNDPVIRQLRNYLSSRL